MLKKYFPELDIDQFWDDDELALEEYVDETPSDTLIASVENELGYKLPESYIALMKHHNGGVPYATCMCCRKALMTRPITSKLPDF